MDDHFVRLTNVGALVAHAVAGVYKIKTKGDANG
jgi:hypothetical protein